MRNNKVIVLLTIGLLFFLIVKVDLKAQTNVDNPQSTTIQSTHTPYHGGVMTGGLSNVSVYIDTGPGSGAHRSASRDATFWERLIVAASNNWMYTGFGANPIYINYVNNTNGSKIDIYAESQSFFINNTGNLRTFGMAINFDSSYNPILVNQLATTNWYSSDIILNDDLLKNINISDNEATSVIKHEIGHSFGLAHTNIHSIMRSPYCLNTSNPCSLNNVVFPVLDITQNDHNAINILY